MSLLESILALMPGLGHYAFCEMASNTTASTFNTTQLPFDTATVVGTSLTVTTASGSTRGRINVVDSGSYLLLGVSGITFAASTDSLQQRVRKTGSVNVASSAPYDGASHFNQIRGIQFMQSYIATAIGGTDYFGLYLNSVASGDALKAGYPWCFVARIA